ncbi:hypothetical protein BC936DRAFT_139361 [Jimgerdemannia flammicorona]|uniref:Replication factor A protein 3 n=1 Tax=Jimgerdemannia flammicorona TaxID=994334 RepID=A0A433DHS3_9FUNG|nr:hypothetical protein BC936DRAFT_139361 [Jimgerdemannia flammicorona]
MIDLDAFSPTQIPMEATPRINSELRSQYCGQIVRIVSKVIRIDGKIATIEAPDSTQVQVTMADDSQWGTLYVELIARVESNLSLTELASTDFGDSFDMELANKVVLACQQYRDIF